MTENSDINYRRMYKRGITNSLSSAKVIVPLICKVTHPKSVIDIGCGVGVWLSEFRRNGVPVVNGVDGPWVLNESLLIEKENIEIYDFEDDKRSVQSIKSKRYDLAVCLEMAEHVSANRADYIIKTLTQAADVIYFSGATPYSGGMHHINEQWQSYWISKFEHEGYIMVDYIRPKIWNNRNVCYFYAEESFLFVKKEKIEDFPELKQEIRDNVICNLVHPIHFKDQIIKPTHNWDYLFSMQKRLFLAYIKKIKSENLRKIWEGKRH